MFKTAWLILRRIVGEAILMAKNLTFWSVILGFVLGVFTNSADNMPLSAWDAGDARFWRFFVLLLIAIISGIVFYFVERKHGDSVTATVGKIDTKVTALEQSSVKLHDDIAGLIAEIRQDRDERNKTKPDSHAK